MMGSLQVQPLTDCWIAASWEEYARQIEAPGYEKAIGYYYRGHMRLEMLPVGFDHGTDHNVVALVINLYGICKGIPLTLADNCTYRRTGRQECQPDLSAYIGGRARLVPKNTSIVSLDEYPAPDLVVEVAKTTLLDDLGTKRSLYEEMGVAEYWVVDVQNVQVIAYAIRDLGSQQIEASYVLPGLEMALLKAALELNRQTDQSQVGAWLLSQMS